MIRERRAGEPKREGQEERVEDFRSRYVGTKSVSFIWCRRRRRRKEEIDRGDGILRVRVDGDEDS